MACGSICPQAGVAGETMDDFRTFEGKSIDDAISQALKFFDVSRSQLEIDIISDAKSGIFGIVGARKAQIKARRRESARKQVEAITKTGRALGRGSEKAAAVEPDPPAVADPAAPAAEEPASPAPASEAVAIEDAAAPKPDAKADAKPDDAKPKPRRSRSRSKAPAKAAPPEPTTPEQSTPSQDAVPAPAEACPVLPADDAPENGEPAPSRAPAPAVELSESQQEAIVEMVQRMMEQLLTPMVGEPVLQISMPEPGKVLVGIDAGDDAGLLIGKEGCTLSALQYLANRILAKQWALHHGGDDDELASVPVPRLSLEAGDYKERQDDGLRQLALSLADKVKSTGKAQSTRPLSSYHRRVVHLALQEDGTLVTRSKGDGALKRVVIMPKKSRSRSKDAASHPNGNQQSAQSAADAGNDEGKKPRRPRRPRRRRGSGKGAQGENQAAATTQQATESAPSTPPESDG